MHPTSAPWIGEWKAVCNITWFLVLGIGFQSGVIDVLFLQAISDLAKIQFGVHKGQNK